MAADSGRTSAPVTCPECGETAACITAVRTGTDSQRRIVQCQQCGHETTHRHYREKRIDTLLPAREDWPTSSAVRWSENLPEMPEDEDGAVLLVLGPHEWDSLGSRTSLTFHEDVAVEVRKGRSPGVGFHHGDGVGQVEIDLPAEAIQALHRTGHWGASVGDPYAPLHIRVVVQADA